MGIEVDSCLNNHHVCESRFPIDTHFGYLNFFLLTARNGFAERWKFVALDRVASNASRLLILACLSNILETES